MIEQVNGFITPMKGWDAVEKNDKKITGTENGTKSVFQSVLEDTVQNVYDTQKDVEQKPGVSLLAFEVYAFYIKSVARSFYSQLLLLWIPMRTKFPLCFLSAFFLMLFLIPFI